jgi:hypothetical protein
MFERTCPHDGAGFCVRLSETRTFYIAECLYCLCQFHEDGSLRQRSVFCRPITAGAPLIPDVQGASGSDFERGGGTGRL